MIKEHAFVAKIEELDNLIVAFQKKIIKKKKVNARLLEQFKEFKALRKILVAVLDAELSTDKILEEDDWKVLLKNSKISARAKAAITKVLEANKECSNPKEFVQMVERFYVHRYNNQEKFDVKTEIENYREQLEHSIEYTLKQKGVTAKGTDLSANLILLLRGRLKETETAEGLTNVELVPTVDGLMQFNLSLDSKKIPLTKITDKLNTIPLIKDWNFKIAETYLAMSVVGVASYNNNRVAQFDLLKVNDEISVLMDVLTGDVGRSFTNSSLSFTSSVAASDSKVSIDLGDYGAIDFGIKLIDFRMDLGESIEIAPIEAYGKWTLSSEKHKKIFEKYQALMELTTLKLEVAVTVSTTLGVDLEKIAKDKILAELDKTIKATERIANKEIDYLKNQETFNDLMDRKTPIDQLKKKNKALGRLIAKEQNPAKKKSLLKLKGKQNIELIKRHQAFNKALEKDGVKNLETLKNQLKNQKEAVDKLFKEALKQTEELQAKIAKPAYKLMAELLQKQASKRLLSLVMKAVPGLNVISLALDIYDAYTLYQDISAAYMDADTEMEIDEDLAEQIANASVDLNEIPEIVIAFFTWIGAGGHLTELKLEEVEELEVFFKEHFPEGENSIDFTKFMFSYNAYYDTETVSSNRELIRSLLEYKMTYNKDLIIQEGEVIQLDASEFENADTTNFFKKATYKIKEGTPLELGTTVKVDASGLDKNSKGEERQITVPNNNLIVLEVTKILDTETTELKSKENFVLKVENFKTYRLQEGATFIYNINNKSILRK